MTFPLAEIVLCLIVNTICLLKLIFFYCSCVKGLKSKRFDIYPTTRKSKELLSDHTKNSRKIYYDIVNLKDKEVNWIENLLNYVTFSNESSREESGWCSPFEMCYGRVSNFVKMCESKSSTRYRNTKCFKLQEKDTSRI